MQSVHRRKVSHRPLHAAMIIYAVEICLYLLVGVHLFMVLASDVIGAYAQYTSAGE